MMASTEVVPEIAVAEPVQEKMKSHGIMNQVMARLLSEDHKVCLQVLVIKQKTFINQ